MGQLVPEDFPLQTLKNDEERVVVEALCDGLSDSWYVLPSVGLLDYRDFEIDVVLVHPRNGVYIVEVKGHQLRIADGIWRDNRGPLSPQPMEQARSNAFTLRDFLRNLSPDLKNLEVDYTIAFPNTAEIRGGLPPNLDRKHLMLSDDLLMADEAIDNLTHSRWQSLFPEGAAERVVKALRPDAVFDTDPTAAERRAHRRLENICANQVRALERLDANRRVCVTGGAGTGKTRLALGWARRAIVNGHRTLVTCYNDPLGDVIRERMVDSDLLRIGPFLRMARTFEGMPPIDEPDDAGHAWWTNDLVGHLIANWHLITERFDTIVVDEAQDFSPAWLALLEQLLDEDGPQHMFMVADTEQDLFHRSFTLPSDRDGWTRCELVNNCRNTFGIARLLRQRLNGAAAPVGGPESAEIEWVEAHDYATATDGVEWAINRLLGRGLAPESIFVATVSQATRDALIERLGLVRWEDRKSTGDDETARIVCETVRRAKGLEFDHVILVAPTERFDQRLIYVGVGRAVIGLTVVANREHGDALGLTR